VRVSIVKESKMVWVIYIGRLIWYNQQVFMKSHGRLLEFHQDNPVNTLKWLKSYLASSFWSCAANEQQLWNWWKALASIIMLWFIDSYYSTQLSILAPSLSYC
jgi:hypothetical protein